MLDLPQEPAIVHEYFVKSEAKTAFQAELEIMDLSFYNTLAGGMCSGSSSSGPDRLDPGCEIQNQKDA